MRHWWENPTHDELSDLHWALRLAAKHPKLSDEEAGRVSLLADQLWNGYFTARAVDRIQKRRVDSTVTHGGDRSRVADSTVDSHHYGDGQ